MKKFFSLLTLCLLSTGLMLAQTKTVSGTVVDDKGEPVIGANIIVEGTSIGTITDFDGNFTLDVPADAKNVVVSYMGCASQTLPVQSVMKVTMKEDTEEIEEVIVTGYGVQSKGSFAGSAQAVDAETIESKNPSEITKALAGEVSGVQVIQTSGQPGTNATLVIRGVGSLNGSATPLYVVDGVAYNGDISAIDPGDIASTTVLKDASATSLYGSRGANGVVVITTKKGNKNDDGKIDVDVKYGGNMRLLPLYDVITSPEEYITMSWMSLYNGYKIVSGMTEDKSINNANKNLFSNKGLPVYYNLWDADPSTLVNPYDENGNLAPSFAEGINRRKGFEQLESWKDAMFRVGQKAEATVKFHGGTDKVNYFTSFGYLKDEGYYRSSDFDRFSVRSNIDYQPKKWLKANLNIAYAYTSFNNPNQDGDGAMNNGFFYLNAIPAIYPVYLRDAEGNIAIDPRTGEKAFDYGSSDLEGNTIGRSFGYGINPAGAVLVDKEQQIQHNVNAVGSFDISLVKKNGHNLDFTATVGAQYMNNVYSKLTNKWYGDAAGLGRILKQSANYFNLQANQQFDYNGTINDKHNIRAMIGHETQMYQETYVYGYKSLLANGESLELSNAVKMQSIEGNKTGYTMESYYILASYMFDEKYFIQGNYRADGSSRYAKGHRWGHFGGVSAGWNFTNENFMDGVKWLRNGKLHLSWGLNGNQMSSLYAYTDLYTIDNVNDQIAYVWASKGNQDITWERSNMVDAGLNVSFDKYVDFEFDYFYKVTDNMLFYRYVAPSLGYSSIPTNDAKMLNQGVEFNFNIHAVNQKSVKLDIRLNGAHYKNKMLQMPVDYYDENGDPVRMIMSGAMAVGHSMYDHYTVVYGGVDDQGNSLFEALYDASITDEAGNPVGFNEPYVEEETGLQNYNYISSLYQYEQEHPNADIRDTMITDYSRAASRYIGKSYLPDLSGGLGLNLEVYGVTLDIATSYQIGGYGYDNTYIYLMNNSNVGNNNWHVDMRNAWTEATNDAVHALPIDQQIPRLSNGLGEFDQYANAGSTRFLTSNSYFSLNSIQLGYNFPKKILDKIKLNRLNLYVSATNLAIATARKGYNPMTSFVGSSDISGYSPLSTIMGGIKLTF